MNSNWREIIQEIPFVDAHCHVMPQEVGKYATGSKPFSGKSPLAGLFLGYGSMLCFLAAGMGMEEVNGIRDGSFSKETCRDIVLRYLPTVETSLPVAFCRRGLSLLAGEPVDILRETWMRLETLLETAGKGQDHLLSAMEQQNIEKVVLNMWTGWSASYYGKYHDGLSINEKRKDQKAYVSLATFDSYAIEPFTPATREYARLMGSDAESFDGYDHLIEDLADFFVTERSVRGFKISEAYYRSLDYHPVSRQEAKPCFKENPSADERRTLSDYVTWKIFGLARQLDVPVQIHTGELWGDTKLAQGNPMHLQTALQAFPEVRFDLLHGGYPFMAETGILGTNFKNITINMAYMPLRSLSQFRQWLDIYCNVISGNRILLGTDVFDVECMTGCIDMIRDSCAILATEMEERQIAPRRAIKDLFERLLHKNAEELFHI